MTGVDIVGALLLAETALTEVVPADRIKAAVLSDGIALPALLVRTVRSVDRQPLKRGGFVRVTDRVSVTVRAASYESQRAVIKLFRKLAGRTGNIGGGLRVSILTAGIGPDVGGPAASFEQTQDFRVTFDDPT